MAQVPLHASPPPKCSPTSVCEEKADRQKDAQCPERPRRPRWRCPSPPLQADSEMSPRERQLRGGAQPGAHLLQGPHSRVRTPALGDKHICTLSVASWSHLEYLILSPCRDQERGGAGGLCTRSTPAAWERLCTRQGWAAPTTVSQAGTQLCYVLSFTLRCRGWGAHPRTVTRREGRGPCTQTVRVCSLGGGDRGTLVS